tara:strand:+ start:551 stop:850 length:300 start_codon:yes stop_codon:yes gene_type:complete
MYKKLNKDEIKLLRLLSDAYNFGNIADVHCVSNSEDEFVGNYEKMDLVNELDPRLVSQICNPISKVITSILGQELHDVWINGSNYDVDWLIRLTESEVA